MTYKETIEFLYSQLPVFHRIGKAAYKADLNNTITLDNYFGHPHRNFMSVHVAGTNGKGSVSHMVASVLQEAGYKTGLYTSPHLKDYRERIRINGSMIPEEEVTEFVAKNLDFINGLRPSFFELSVALAFNYFASENVDIAVIETGLGGRLDSTNIITPLLSVITNIGYDHMDLLGNTLELIATEKAGIIKSGIPVIIGEKNVKTDDVFINKAGENQSGISFAQDLFDCSFELSDPVSGSRKFTLTDLKSGNSAEGIIPLGGDYQLSNLKVVAASIDVLKQTLLLSQEHFLKGVRNVIKNTGLSGRWQILGKDPLIVCDTGHNEHGLVHVLNQIGQIPKSGLHMVLGFVNDKDLSLVLPMFPKDAMYYFTKASVPRAMDEKLLQQRAAEFGLKGDAYQNVKNAINAAKKRAGKTDMIFIGGSTFVVADAL